MKPRNSNTAAPATDGHPDPLHRLAGAGDSRERTCSACGCKIVGLRVATAYSPSSGWAHAGCVGFGLVLA